MILNQPPPTIYTQTFHFIKARDGVVRKLLAHIETSAIAELLLKLVAADDILEQEHAIAKVGLGGRC